MASVLKVDKLDPQSGTALEIGTSGDTISIPSGATLDISASTLTPPATMPASSGINLTALNATNLGSGTVPTARLGTGTASSSVFLAGDNTWAAAGGDNTPYVVVRPSGNTTISDATWTTVTLDNEILDSDGAFSSNTFTVPSGKAGKYLISYSVRTLCTTFAISTEATIGIDGTRDNVPLQDWNFDPDYEVKIFTLSNTYIKDLSVGEAVTLEHTANTDGGSPEIREFGTYLSIMRILT
jgi:hypothetical protein